jgi:hypothetical protein
MSKFKEGDKIIRTEEDQPWAPLGFESVVDCNYLYTSFDGFDIEVVDEHWELAEDTSKPVTEEYEGNVYEIGKRYAFTDNLPLGDDFTVSRLNFIYAPSSDPSYVFDSEGLPYRYAVSLSEVNLDAGTITPAPINLIDGNAYMFDYKGASYIGIYTSPPHRFIQVDGFTLSSYCTNIRPMTVAESK